MRERRLVHRPLEVHAEILLDGTHRHRPPACRGFFSIVDQLVGLCMRQDRWPSWRDGRVKTLKISLVVAFDSLFIKAQEAGYDRQWNNGSASLSEHDGVTGREWNDEFLGHSVKHGHAQSRHI
jgi:hypothetical protein